MTTLLDKPIEFLKGVGPIKADLLKAELGIYTFRDMIEHYPFRYVDRTTYVKIADLNPELPYVQVRGKIAGAELMGSGRKKRLEVYLQDDTGRLKMVWFKGVDFMRKKLKLGKEFIVYGKPSTFGYNVQFSHPEIEEPSERTGLTATAFQPVYPTTEKLKAKGVDSKAISRMQYALVNQLGHQIPETLSSSLLMNARLMLREQALMKVHFPKSQEEIQQAQYRLKFEELFFIQLRILRKKVNRTVAYKGLIFKEVGSVFHEFYENHLPFELTGAQKRVIREIHGDLRSGKQMNRLVQGDVGSGKTLVALMSMFIALGNSYQACLMAPTEILANQHFETISEMCAKMDIKVGLLTGSSKKSERNVIHEGLEDGSLSILIGTHALLEDKVKWKNLGLAVIDEQHRFGVAQRARLWKKNALPPHVLVMTATPIPRTLAMTLYGDLDTSVIDELPPGRKEIKTLHRYDSSRLQVFGFMKEQIRLGRQVYVVYPLIEESDAFDYKDLMDGYESIQRSFPAPDYHVSIVHGKMKAEDKDYEMQRFARGETQIMVATTVIEVGVNVPNASVMVIESAEKFGLAQLHQLRGRVGRGAEQSYCILMTGYKLSDDGKKRIETMVRSSDGFEIAEVDMKLRGPGDIEGTQQSGLLDLKIANIVHDQHVMQYARDQVTELLKNDPELSDPENLPILNRLNDILKNRPDWSRIS